MLFPGGFTFPNFLTDVFSIFIFVLWFWLLITVFSDLFRRRDISGWGKVVWAVVLIIFPAAPRPDIAKQAAGRRPMDELGQTYASMFTRSPSTKARNSV
jgi:hypothetical protein